MHVDEILTKLQFYEISNKTNLTLLTDNSNSLKCNGASFKYIYLLLQHTRYNCRILKHHFLAVNS